MGELSPLRRRRFVAAEAAVALFRAAPSVDYKRFRTDLDLVASQDPSPVPEERRHERGLLDTSVIIDMEMLEPSQLPGEEAVSALTMAELAAGPYAMTEPEERGRKARGASAVDLLIAATALAAGLSLYTRNAQDVQALDHLVEVVVV